MPVLRLPGGGVAVECAKVIGLADLDRLDPLAASSRGLGELLARLQDQPRLWVGLGGSATVDGGRDWPALDLPRDDRVLRREDRPGRRRAPLRTAEGRASRGCAGPGGAAGRAGPAARAAHGRGRRVGREAALAGRRAGRRRRADAGGARLRRGLPRAATRSSPAKAGWMPPHWKESCRSWWLAARARWGCGSWDGSARAGRAGRRPPRCSTRCILKPVLACSGDLHRGTASSAILFIRAVGCAGRRAGAAAGGARRGTRRARIIWSATRRSTRTG